MVKHSVDIRRENTLIIVIDGHSRIGPPQERLRDRRRIIQPALNLQIGFPGAKRKSGRTPLMEHPLALIDPHGRAAVFQFLDGPVDRRIGAGTMVLRPVELDASRNPRPGQTDERRFDDMVVVDEMALLDFIISHLDPAAKLREDHDFHIFILEPQRLVRFIHRFVLNLLDNGIGVDHSAAALINSLLKEHRILFRFPYLISRDDNILLPDFNFHT